tara:strand:- start:593 stop:835 length:243 start_codon:yes stop_codon:yes gene_type:complete
MKMFNKMCYYFSGQTGQCLVGALGVVGGLHLLLSAAQPVLGFLPSFSMSVGSMTVGAQQLLGLGLLISSVCVLGSCRRTM